MNNAFEQDYLNTVFDVMYSGEDIKNIRTGAVCRTIPFEVYQYTNFPAISSKQVFLKSAIAEMVGYLRGYTNAADFRRIGTRTWDSNANETKAWLANPNRKGEDDMGRVYGAIGRDWNGTGNIDLLYDIYEDLKKGVDNRGEILTFWKPDEFDKGCLRPCMHTHQFTLINGVLYLTSIQRSTDVGLGLPFNMVQVWFLLSLMAQITGHKVGGATHMMTNVHIYENQFDSMYDLLKREVRNDNNPELVFDPRCVNLNYVLDEANTIDDIVKVVGYTHSGKLEVPFTS